MFAAMKSRATQGILALGAVLALSAAARADDLPAPYHEMQNNIVYNALFCDSEGLVKPKDAASAQPWQKALFAASPDVGAVRAVAEDAKQSSCVRLFAYKWLREHSQLVPFKQLLGVVLEVPVDEGLDTLVAYDDGHVRYISHADKLSVVDMPNGAILNQAKVLFISSNKLMARIGVWNKKRLPAPAKGKVRMSFLATDGLYFGEGSFAAIQKDADAAQVVKDGTALLQAVVDLGKTEK